MDHPTSDIPPDVLSPSWPEATGEIRSLLAKLSPVVRNSPSAQDYERLQALTLRLCSHLEQIHQQAAKYLDEPEKSLPSGGSYSVHKEQNPEEFVREAIQIERESHEHQGSFKEIIKALFLWQDHPDERIEKKP